MFENKERNMGRVTDRERKNEKEKKREREREREREKTRGRHILKYTQHRPFEHYLNNQEMLINAFFYFLEMEHTNLFLLYSKKILT